MDQENKNLFGLTIEANTASTMSSSAQWSRILAWCGIIMGAMLVIFGLLFQMMLSKATSINRFESNDGFAGGMAFAGGAGMVMYIIMGGLTILGNVFLLNYANKISTALKTNDQGTLNAGFAGLRNYMAFWGIIMIICLLFMLIGFASIMTSM
jgi:hypothetical protein